MIWLVISGILVIFIIINETMLFFSNNQGSWTEYTDKKMMNAENDRLAILIHEYMANPDSMDFIAQKLHQQGWNVVIPAMPGSAKSSEELDKNPPSLYHHWVQKAENVLKKQSDKYSEVVLIGASLGGTIALDLASRNLSPGITKIICLSSPIKLLGRHYRRFWLRNAMVAFSGLVAMIKPRWRTGILKEEARKLEPFYGVEGVLLAQSIHSHRLGMRQLRHRLHRVHQETLLIHARGDRTVGFDNMELIGRKCGARHLRMVALELDKDQISRKHHIWNHMYCRDRVYNEINSFINGK